MNERPIPRHTRRRFIAKHLELDDKRVLEVGAFDSPTFRGPRAPDVRYLDWFSRDELRERPAPRRNPEATVDVDYVVKEKRFANEISERFDLIVANHVIEHVADPITWLQQLAELTRPGGHLFLSVPDRRFIFDYLRSESTVVQLLRAHHDDLERAEVWQVLDSRYYYRPLGRDDFDGGPPSPEKLGRRRLDLRQALDEAKRVAESYAGVHCFVYTSSSFRQIIADLADAGYLPWTLVDADDATEDSREFHALFVRRP